MARIWRTIVLLTLFSAISLRLEGAVDIVGIIQDPDSVPLPGIMVRLYQEDKIKAFTTSRSDGSFTLKADTLIFPAKIVFASKNHKTLEKEVDDINAPISVMLQPERMVLEEVVVKAPKVRVKGDTIKYDVAAYTENGDRNIEDVIRRLPGVQVSESGQIMYDGNPINNFYIEGLNLMGGNYTVASRNILPSDISSISVYERHQPTKALQGIESSNSAALDLKLKNRRMLKPIGHVEGGAGVSDAGDAVWVGNLYVMAVSPKNQTILSADGNNTGRDYADYPDTGDAAIKTFSRTPFGVPQIDAPRYLFNKSAYFTANTLTKLNDDCTLTFNSSYALDHDRFSGSSATEYIGADLEDPYYSETAGNALFRHIVNVSAKFEKNSEDLFIKDLLYFGGTFNHNDYSISNSSAIQEKLRNRNYYFHNEFSTVIRKGNRATQIQSVTSYGNTPLNNLSASDGMSDVFLTQSVNGHKFHNRENASLSWSLSRYSSIGLKLNFRIYQDMFSSLGEEYPSHDEPIHINEISGYKLTFSAAPSYTFTIPGHLSAELSIPVTWRNLRYHDRHNGIHHLYDKINPGFNLQIWYKINSNNNLTLNAKAEHSTGGIDNFITNPIFTTFRNTTIPGAGYMSEARSKEINMIYSLRNILSNFHFRVMTGYKKTNRNTMSARDVSQDGTSLSLTERDASSDISTVILTASKGISEIHTKINADISGIRSRSETLRSQSVIKSTASSFSASVNVRTDLFDRILSIFAGGSWMVTETSFASAAESLRLSDISANGKISVFPVKGFELYGKISFNRSQITTDTYKNSVLIDAGASYSIGKIRFDLSLRNLTDIREYGYTVYNSLDITKYSYQLRPLEALLSVRLDF